MIKLNQKDSAMNLFKEKFIIIQFIQKKAIIASNL
jgi:hypothetical protein